ncbi:HP0495 family protein [Helicobacter mesocricetorum]|uniref:HP0495 family protein n=1 Tax=Helicobacter mesocricetorum TaxID=87012 RepID=UPI000CF18D91|nr:DUF493 domain-containing protein [Helicobacter mesocricetorum]
MFKEKIQYPCQWHYRIIGESKEALNEAALEILDKEFITTPCKESKNGKYHSINIEVLVHNQKERDEIFTKLQQDKRIHYIL